MREIRRPSRPLPERADEAGRQPVTWLILAAGTALCVIAVLLS